MEHAKGCFGEWEGEECTCGAYDAYLKNIEAKEADADDADTADNAADVNDADGDIPAAYRTAKYSDLSAGWLTRLIAEGHISPLPQGTSAYLLVGSNGESEELREWCSRYSAPRLAYLMRQIYGV